MRATCILTSLGVSLTVCSLTTPLKSHLAVLSEVKWCSGGGKSYLDLSTQMVAAGQVVNTGSVLAVEVVAGLLPLFMMLSIVITSSGLTEQTLEIILSSSSRGRRGHLRLNVGSVPLPPVSPILPEMKGLSARKSGRGALLG